MVKKILLGGAIGLVVLIVVASIVVGLFLGTLIKTGMETVGPRIAQVSIKVDAVKVSLLTGSASVKGLVIGNPAGYQAPYAISVGTAAAGVNSFSVLSDKIVVRTVRVAAPEINFEGNPFSGNNLGKIMQNVNAFTQGSGSAATNTTARTSPKSGKKIEVDDFLITGARVNFHGATLTLPEVHLTNLGKGSDGITAADLTHQVLEALTSACIKAVTSAAADLGKSAGNVGKDLGKSLGTGASNLTKGLGGLFKK